MTTKANKLERNQEKDSERKTPKVTKEREKYKETELKKMIPKQRGRERRKMAQRDNDNKKQRESWKAKYDDET